MTSAFACMTGVALGALVVLTWNSPGFLLWAAAHFVARCEALHAYRAAYSDGVYHWMAKFGVEPAPKKHPRLEVAK